VAKRKTLFDDRPIEISELTYVIRQDIASLNTQIASLQSYIRAQKQPQVAAGKGQVEEHNSNVVMMLQSRLADMGMGFKDVLELRTQVSEISMSFGGEIMGYLVRGGLWRIVGNMEGAGELYGNEGVTGTKADEQNMKASKDRSEQFMHTTANSTLQPANSTSQLFVFIGSSWSQTPSYSGNNKKEVQDPVCPPTTGKANRRRLIMENKIS
jgi:hypothetical protein